MEELPEDIFNNILFFLKKDNDPLDLYKLQSVNKTFYKEINDTENNYDKDYILKDKSLQNNINRLCFRGNKKIFKWLFKNNIFLTENNILNLVENNRLDILKLCIFYNPINDIHWRREGDDGTFNWDNSEYDSLITWNKNVYILSESDIGSLVA